MVKERLEKLKKAMKNSGVDVYYFNTSDYHMSEYVPEHFKTIAYYSGFTGSLATLLVSADKTVIFVDGRYHVQADKECLKNGVEVVKLGTENALSPIDYLKTYFAGKTIGLDGKRTSISFAKQLLSNNLKIKSIDIYSSLIEDRAPLKKDPIYELDLKYTGLSRKRKIELISHVLNGNTHIVNNLESIAYLLNLRSDDIKYTPVFMAYLVIHKSKVYLFVDEKRLNDTLLYELYDDEVIVRDYDAYYEFLDTISNSNILLDENKVNYETYLHLDNKHNHFVNKLSVIEEMKAIKNYTEQKNMRMAHIYDGVALVRFLRWLESVDKTNISEYDVANTIDYFRKEYKANDLSFASIVAYNENAAQMHYSAKKLTAAKLENKGILLFDTGGQYDEGTTDVTRTVALGEVDDEVKKYFTLVLKSMFNLSEVKFMQGLNGNQLDILARKDLWELGVDYRCGTGHGVGYNLSVHEGPPNVRYGHNGNGTEMYEIKPGMIFSDEPGVYFEGKFGIRCENLLLCKKDIKNEYGQFLSFEHLTLCPFDLNLIDKNYLDQKTIDALNNYHKKVYETLCPYLDEEEQAFLKEKTREI